MDSSTINGFKIVAPKSKEELLGMIFNTKKILIAINAEKIYHANSTLKSISQMGIAYPDGVGAVMALKRIGLRESIRIPGSELWLDIIKKAQGIKTVFIIGATQKVLEATLIKLKKDYPELDIVGAINGYDQSKDLAKVEKKIVKFKPDIVFVAQGSPKQEMLMERLYQSHKAVYMGLGGSFDVYMGSVKRAPYVYQKLWLEWFYRLLTEPSRIRRQWVLVPFLFNLYRRKY